MAVNRLERVTGLICARGGSKGLPGKNVRPLAGKPLIVYSIEVALAAPSIDRVIVSTDSEEIADIALAHGAEVPFLRPASLATDTAAEWDVWKHIIAYLDAEDAVPDALVVLPATSPLRSIEDVEDTIQKFADNECDGVMCGTNSICNPHFSMVKLDEDGFCKLAISDGKKFARRQDAPKYFDLVTVCYVMNPDHIRSSSHMLDGRLLLQPIPQERAADIDTFLDFAWAEFLMQRKQEDNASASH